MQIKSIRTVLVASFMALVLSGTAIMAWYVVSSSYTSVVGIEKRNMEGVSSTLSIIFASFVKDMMSQAKFVAECRATQDYFAHNDVEQAAEMSGQLFRLNPLIETIGVFDDKGVANFLRLPGNKPGPSLNLSDRPYVKAVLSGQEHFTSLPFKSRTTGRLVCTFSCPVRKGDKIIGGILLAITVDDLLKNYIDGVKIGKSGYPYVHNAAGVLALHPVRDNMLKDLSSKDFIKQSLASESGIQDYQWEGKEKIQSWRRVPGTDWTVVTTTYKDELSSSARDQRFWVIVVGAAQVVLLLAALYVLMNRLVFSPLSSLAEYARKLSGGDLKARLSGNFRYELADLSGSIGSMVGVLKNRLGFAQGILDGLSLPALVSDEHGKILFANQHIVDLIEIGGQANDYVGTQAAMFFYNDPSRMTITQRSCQERKALLGIMADVATRKGKTLKCKIDATPVYDLDGQVLAGIALVTDLTEVLGQKATIEAQRDRLQDVALRIDDVSRHILALSATLGSHVEGTASAADLQQRRINETAVAIDQMSKTIVDVADNAASASKMSEDTRGKALEGFNVVSKIIDGVKDIQLQSEELRRDMGGLEQQAESIGKVLEVISDIADQTNLLALNAAIEAARAGDAGRGFAVVADEVRKLAEKTMNATREVADAIHNIQSGTNKNIGNVERVFGAVESASAMATASGESLQEIVTLAEHASAQVHSIAAASEEQSASSEEISRSITEVNVVAGKTSDAMQEAARTMHDFTEQARGLQGLIEELRRG